MNKNAIKLIIRRIKADNNMSVKELSNILDIEKTRIDAFMNDRIKKYDDIVNAIKQHYSKYLDIKDNSVVKEQQAEYVPKSEFRKVPIVTQFAYASYSEYWDDPEYIDNLEYMPTTIPDDGNYLWFIVKGESMECDDHRSIPDGSMVLARELYRKYWDKFNLDKVWVIHHKSMGIMVKKIESNSNGTVICKSYNPTVEDFPISINDINQLFYVKILHKKL